VSVLVVDVGTSGVRGAVVRPDGSVGNMYHREVLPSSPAPAFVEFDALEMARAVVDVAHLALGGAGTVDAVGIANQRASTIVWDRTTGQPVGPGIGWQDLRTVGTCLALREQGIRVAPNESVTKLAMLLDMADPARERDLCFGTVDSWVVWTLTKGAAHVVDATNAGISGLLKPDASGWNETILEALRIPEHVLPRVVDSTGVVTEAHALPGTPPIAGIAGDQQASLIGQGGIERGLAKATFGTGGMLDLCVGTERPSFTRRGEAGTFPILAWRQDGRDVWGVEAVMLSAGTCVEWLRDDLGLIATVAESDTLASSVDDAGGVVFVPALLGLGTPTWDFGARGTLLGLTRGTTRAHVVRAVLEGVANRGADLLESAEADTGGRVEVLRVDGGMSANTTFVQSLADATGRPVAVAPVTEATTLGAAFLAGVATGVWSDLAEATSTQTPRAVVEPRRRVDRERWLAARERAQAQVPELSTLDF
jgi:glycerol kinase